MPSKLDIVLSFLSLRLPCLCVESINFVPILKNPFTVALGFVVVEVASEVTSIRILPLATNHLTLQELTHEFLSRLGKYISSLSVFLTVRPVARVDVSIFVGHDSFSMSLPILPVAVVVTDSFVVLFADSRLKIVLPRSLISVAWSTSFTLLSCLSGSVDTLTMSELQEIRYGI